MRATRLQFRLWVPVENHTSESKMKKEIDMICVSDIEGFDRKVYEASKVKLTEHLAKFGWKFGDCVVEEDDKVWSCKPAAIWFLTPDFVCHTED